MVTKTVGAADVLRARLASLESRINIAFIFGSVARGTACAGSDLDLMVIGDVTFGEVVSELRLAEKTIRRPVNASVYPRAEFRSKLTGGNHFLGSVQSADKVFVIGSEHELAALCG